MKQNIKYKHKHTSSSAWRTPLYSLDHGSAGETEQPITIGGTSISHASNLTATAAPIVTATATVTHSVRVPVNGLYGFIFGTKKHGEEFEVNKHGGKKGGSSKGQNTQLMHCGCTYKASFHLNTPNPTRTNDGDGDGDENRADQAESILLPLSSPTYDRKVITSTRVAKVFYIPKDTEVSIQCNSSCDHDEEKHQTGWVWGLVNQKKFDSDRAMASSCSSPPEKKAKNDICHLVEDSGKVQFNPTQSTKKPLLCTECVRKFPTCQAVRNHYVTTHAPKLGDDQGTCADDDYLDLVGHKIFRTPLDVAYEDDELVIIVKPQGVPVQGR